MTFFASAEDASPDSTILFLVILVKIRAITHIIRCADVISAAKENVVCANHMPASLFAGSQVIVHLRLIHATDTKVIELIPGFQEVTLQNRASQCDH